MLLPVAIRFHPLPLFSFPPHSIGGGVSISESVADMLLDLNSTIPWEHICLGITFTFVLGAIVGSFLNVCIYRLPRGESLFWPGSRCGHCLQPVRWYDNIPLLSYWVLGGRCRTCRLVFSSRYFWIELLTAASYACLFCIEVLLHNPGGSLLERLLDITPELFIVWGFHALLISFLIMIVFAR
jgi:prepilin signal peptidase PulO-like enzyme (type II secretory pathway)